MVWHLHKDNGNKIFRVVCQLMFNFDNFAILYFLVGRIQKVITTIFILPCFLHNQSEHETIYICAICSNNTYPAVLSQSWHPCALCISKKQKSNSKVDQLVVKKLMSLGWEVKRRKVHHQEPKKYDMVWEITIFNLTPGTTKI